MIRNETIAPVKIAPELLHAIQNQTLQEKQVIVHCKVKNASMEDLLIRIWPTTFLVDRVSGHRSKLVHHEHITLYPYWTLLPGGVGYTFTLIFSGLPDSCTSFDLLEDIPQEGGFFVPAITRNNTDIYNVDLI
ncbi:MAG TPA: hypothetical protein DCW95_03350 [Chryseobacterium sp.]|nr:hypothetical protein [Chryseobacterium sp.]